MKTMNDINKMINEIASQYISEGYMIDVRSMRGHQGEEGKLFLTKGSELIMIVLEKVTDWTHEFFGMTCWAVSVRKWDHQLVNGEVDRTVWLNESTVLSSTTFYEIKENRNGMIILTDDRDYAAECIRKQNKRWSVKHPYNEYTVDLGAANSKYLDIASKYLKNSCGYKRISYSKLRVIKTMSTDKNHACYKIIYNDTCYRLSH